MFRFNSNQTSEFYIKIKFHESNVIIFLPVQFFMMVCLYDFSESN